MAIEPLPIDATQTRLVSARADDAGLVVSWVRSPGELYWLAPRTPAPLTARQVEGWWSREREALTLLAADGPAVGYGECNLLSRERGSYWLGHLIVAPELRGRGLGRVLVQRMLAHAFIRRSARRVTLVVFPANTAAVRSYLAAGMRRDGYESHYFATRRRRERLLRLAITAEQWAVR